MITPPAANIRLVLFQASIFRQPLTILNGKTGALTIIFNGEVRRWVFLKMHDNSQPVINVH